MADGFVGRTREFGILDGRIQTRIPVLFAALVLAIGVLIVDPRDAHAAAIPTPPTNQAICDPTTSDATVTSFSMTPRSVDVTSVSRKVTITVRAHDTKDIGSVEVSLSSPIVHGLRRSRDVTLKLVAGTRKSGVWRGPVTFPRWTNNGTWKVDSIDVHEASTSGGVSYSPTGRRTSFKNSPGLAFKSTWPRHIHVTSTPDVRSPKLVSLTVSTRAVNTSHAAKRIKVTVRATDNLSGLHGGVLLFAGPDYGDLGALVTLKRSAGTARNGTFTGSLVVPRWAGKGHSTWPIQVLAPDAAGNLFWLGPDELSAKGFVSTIDVSSSADPSQPTISSLTLSATSIDATHGDRRISVTVKASDTYSGVAGVSVFFASPSQDVTEGERQEAFLTRAAAGTWRGSLIIPECSEPGTWTATVYIEDKGGNYVELYAKDLAAKHIPNELSVKAYDVTMPKAIVAAKVRHGHPLVVTFSEPTLWIGSTNPMSVDDSATRASVPGTWTCKDGSGATVGCNADNADVIKATFQPTSAFIAGHSYDVTSQGGIFDLDGNGPRDVGATFKVT